MQIEICTSKGSRLERAIGKNKKDWVSRKFINMQVLLSK